MLQFKDVFRKWLLALTFPLLLPGCQNSAPPATSPTTVTESDGHRDHDHHVGGHQHDHPTKGPHQGDLIELGNEEYHAEIVHSADSTVTIYILDRSATQPVAIDAAEVTLNLSHDGTARQFQLPAKATEYDSEGKSSRFTLSDDSLAKQLDQEGTGAKLVLTIEGKSYSGKIEHTHDHGH